MPNDNTANVNIEALIARRKEEFLKEAKKQASIQEKVALSVPWWLIIIAAGLFALSAGHTVGVFLQLSSLGYAGPFVVEFALLWAAFARVSGQRDNTQVSLALRGLEVLAFIMAIFVNGIGAAERVASLVGIGQFSFTALAAQFGSLPFTTQAIVFLVPLFALFIPIGTWVAGEGLAGLFLKQRQTGTLLDQKWRENEPLEVYRVLYQAFVQNNMKPAQARRQAQSIARGLSAGAAAGLLPAHVEPNAQNSLTIEQPIAAQFEGSAKDRIWAYLDQFGTNHTYAEIAEGAGGVSTETAWRWTKRYQDQHTGDQTEGGK